MRYISAPSDFLWLAILIIIGFSGLMMKFVAHTDVVMVKEFLPALWDSTLKRCRSIFR